ncbi:hypothetical protein Sinac_2493 [Singulisphaera acidiphila DSM 18658]|uniref:Uncharacterized protein n=1 Tax=Singulisphaera acidiphila (strain ATCC BAA-1392 / DSM 18658 / VKM B-2454 / MOB10) TaxID=886293 RepID=L0DC30_SINAD|nr:hypothetical protein Sinac_2493 [Singulisphaera acidiphila DSM 18658]
MPVFKKTSRRTGTLKSVIALAIPRRLTGPFFLIELLKRATRPSGVNQHEWYLGDFHAHRFGMKHRHKMRKMP